MCGEPSHRSTGPRFLCHIASAYLKQQKTTKGRKVERYYYSDNHRILLFDFHFQLNIYQCLSASPCVCCCWITTIGVKMHTIFVHLYTIPINMYTITRCTRLISGFTLPLYRCTILPYRCTLSLYMCHYHYYTEDVNYHSKKVI